MVEAILHVAFSFIASREIRGEGNQVESPTDADGKHRVTVTSAFDYFEGKGQDIAWAAKGMADGQDFADKSALPTRSMKGGMNGILRTWCVAGFAGR